MTDAVNPLDPLTYELCFLGGITKETEISCPHCNTLLTVPVNDPNGEESDHYHSGWCLLASQLQLHSQNIGVN